MDALPVLLNLFAGMPDSIDLAAVSCCDESMEIILAYEFHEAREFGLSEKNLNFDVHLPGEASLYFVEAAASVQLIDDVVPDYLMLLADDADSLLLVDACGEVVDNESVHPCSDETDDHESERMYGECCEADGESGYGDGGADV